jgi:hypothetical protein
MWLLPFSTFWVVSPCPIIAESSKGNSPKGIDKGRETTFSEIMAWMRLIKNAE